MNTMTYKQALSYLKQCKAAGMTMGLSRMERIMELCGNPHRRLKTVHIAGTNGKGSTARMIQAIGAAAGYRVGLFSSPAVTGLRDTINVDNQAISEEAFAAWITRLKSEQPSMGPAGPCSEFELLTAAAFGWLAEQQTDFCVVECGLGGREDATNILPPPLIATFTPVSLDHTAILGTTVEAIARQKCGIIKPPCGIVTAPGQPPEALGVIYETAARWGLSVRQPHRASARITEEDWGRLCFSYDHMDITLPLTGRVQCDNALTAIETMRVLGEKGFPVTSEQICAGLSAVQMPCRQEILSRHPLRLLDGAHNPQGIARLAETLSRLSVEPLVMLMGMLADKDVGAVMELLAPFCREMICCTPPYPERALPAVELAACAARGGVRAVAVPEPAAALAEAHRRAGDGPLLIGGSFYTCAAVRDLCVNTTQK